MLIKRFRLDAGKSPQTYGLGFKELWQLPPGRVEPGMIQHTVGWPMDQATYGGSFLYHLDQDRVYVGFVVGLDYADPRFQPFEAFQQFKNHPSIKALLEGGEILAYGARTIVEGGWQSMPTLEMPGAMLVGDAGGTLNVPKIKGMHQAMRSGALAAEHLRRDGRHGGIRLALARVAGRPSNSQGAQHPPRVQARHVARHGERRARDTDGGPFALDAREPRRPLGAAASSTRSPRRTAAGASAR